MEIKKLLKRSSVAKNMGTSITVVSVCFRIIKQRFDAPEIDGYIRHNILFLKNLPREANIELYKEKQQIISAINKELITYDFRYVLKDIMVK